ncbi:hypothetical protein OH809_06845 [Streptomyces sp. NBC_00873]|uniref:hypothetical protein n=1 Tax=unclassified Streptomyces TaxID=2593676 RepID=UPI003869B916|nr:hypothetical protein OH809_06845 [Streptomyces sp. NBC_00873]WTA49116.1 hypothetical protein OH821_36920 [Streptomyces sp. NBC_00842]
MIEDRSGMKRRGVLAAGLAGMGVALVPAGQAGAEPAGAVAPRLVESAEGGRRVLNFNTNWAFWRDDAPDAHQPEFNDWAWAAVSVPHTMRLETKRPSSAYDVFAARYRQVATPPGRSRPEDRPRADQDGHRVQ